MIAIPEETPASPLAAMIADEAAIGVIKSKNDSSTDYSNGQRRRTN